MSGQDDVLGALVGWKSLATGERIFLHLQTVRTPPPHSSGEVERHTLVLTKQQAVQLGNYLFDLSGQTAPRPRKKSLIDRMLGG